MKSPTTTYKSTGDAAPPVSPAKPPAATTAAPSHAEPFGAVARLPLILQAAFRRKLVAIIALQLAVLCVYVALLKFTSPDWLQSAILDDAAVYVTLGVAIVALLLGLHFARDRFPFNWLVLAALTTVLAFSLAAADVALDSHAALINCVFLCVVQIVTALTAGWTRDATRDCSRLTFGWTPPAASLALEEEIPDRRLASPYLTGFVGYVVACVVVALVSCLVELDWSFDVVIISLFVQLLMNLWFSFQIRTLGLHMTPDAYMSGVIYLYADILIVLAIAGVMALCVAVCGGEGPTVCVGCYPYYTLYPYIGGATNNDADDEQV